MILDVSCESPKQSARCHFPKILELASGPAPAEESGPLQLRRNFIILIEMSSTHASSRIESALEALRHGSCVAILDSESREAETDLFFPASFTTPAALRTLRTQAGGELYIAIATEVATTFGLPYVGQVLGSPKLAQDFPVLQHTMKAGGTAMCQGSCSVGISLDHRSLKTGAPDSERSCTCRRLASLWEEHRGGSKDDGGAPNKAAFGREFHTPGHIFLCVENARGLQARRGHTELSVALARAAGISPIMVGCVMLCSEGDNYGALPSQTARSWAEKHGVSFLTGEEIIESLLAPTKCNGGLASQS